MPPEEADYFHRLDTELTELIRMARNPRLAEKMGAGAAGDSRLFLLLNLLHDRGPSRAADLIDILGVDQSTLSRQLAALVERGFVARQADPSDGRAVRIVVSDLGAETIGNARAAWRSTLGDLMADWSTAERETLLSLLAKLSGELATVVRPPID